MSENETDQPTRSALVRKVRAARRARLVRQWLPEDSSPRPRWLRAAAATAVLVVLVVLGVVQFSRSAPAPEAPPALPAAQVAPISSAEPSTQPLVVSVVGKVRRVGLVRLSGDARVADAIAKAGGARPGVDLAALNLARKLTDGEQIYVGIPTPGGAENAPAAPSGGPVSGSNAGGKVDINTATADQLDQLPGVGEVTAKRIVDWRTQHQRFASVDDLQQVDGIGPAKFAKLREQVTVG